MSREMKHSGIVEGFNIPLQWKTMKFGKICSIVTDFVASGSFADLRANVPYLSEPDYAMLIRTTDLAKTARSEGKVYISKESYEFLSNSNLFGGEVVLPNIGSIGDAYIVPKLYERMSLAPNAIMFKTHYCDKYYYYYFLSKVGKLQLDEISQSTAIAKFNKTDLKQLRVVLPSLSEQQKIASFLDRKCIEIDEMIALQEKIIEELKAYKQSVITEAVTKGLNPDVPMKDSGIEWIGEIPRKWICPKNKYYTRIGSGDGISNEELQDEGMYEVWGGGNSVMGYYHTYNIDEPRLIIGRVGACGYVKYSEGKRFISDNALIMRITSPSISYNYLYYVLVAAELNRLNTSTAQPLITATKVYNVNIPIPPLDEQQSIVNYLGVKCTEIDNLISIKLSKIDSLKEYKKSIIYEYVTGKKEVIE